MNQDSKILASILVLLNISNLLAGGPQCSEPTCSPLASTRSSHIAGNDIPCAGYFKIENALSPIPPMTSTTVSWQSSVTGSLCEVTVFNIE